MEGKVFDNGFVFYTSLGRFYYIYNAYEPYLKEFPAIDVNPKP